MVLRADRKRRHACEARTATQADWRRARRRIVRGARAGRRVYADVRRGVRELFDVLIRNAEMYDGSGAPPRRADVAVRDGRIAAIDPRIDADSVDIVDATGLWLAPGFLDIHTHYDLELEIAPGLSESVRHGVTTVVIGHCSLSITMGEPQTLADIFQRVENFPPA